MDLQFRTLVFVLRNVNGFTEYCFSEFFSEYLEEHSVLIPEENITDEVWKDLFLEWT